MNEIEISLPGNIIGLSDGNCLQIRHNLHYNNVLYLYQFEAGIWVWNRAGAGRPLWSPVSSR